MVSWSLGESAPEWWQRATSGGGRDLGTAFTEISPEGYLRDGPPLSGAPACGCWACLASMGRGGTRPLIVTDCWPSFLRLRCGGQASLCVQTFQSRRVAARGSCSVGVALPRSVHNTIRCKTRRQLRLRAEEPLRKSSHQSSRCKAYDSHTFRTAVREFILMAPWRPDMQFAI